MASEDRVMSDPSMGDESGGKTSLFGKIKNKTKDKSKRLKNKLTPGSKSDSHTGEEADTSSEDESDSPIANELGGMRQSQYKGPEQPKFDSIDKSPNVPSSNFPGSFAGAALPTGKGGEKEDHSGLSKDFEGLSTDDKSGGTEGKPMTEKATDNLTAAKDATVGKVAGDGSGQGYGNTEGKPMTEKATDNLTAAKDATVGATVGKMAGGGSEQKYASPDAAAEDATNKAADASKTWSQWAAEKVGYAKDATAANMPTTAEGKPIHQHAYDSVVGAKDSAVANMPTTAEGKPIHEHAYDSTVAAKDSLAGKAGDTHAAQQTYMQKATSGVVAAKDSLFTSTQPGDHDKALSQKVTESVGNLPATLKSSLGFGGKSPASPTTTPGGTSESALASSDETPQSPGLVSRFTSLFAAKKPATSEESSPTAESGATDTTSEAKSTFL